MAAPAVNGQRRISTEVRRQDSGDILQRWTFVGRRTQQRIDEAAAEIDSAVIANSARWGDAQLGDSDTPFDRQDFLDSIEALRNDFVPARIPIALQQFRETTLVLKDSSGNYTDDIDAPLYPDVDAPGFFVNGQSQFGGEVSSGTQVDLGGAEGTVYYTTDGTDPRDFGGGVNATASSFSTGTTTTTVITEGDNWKYRDEGEIVGTAWRASGFNDSSWASGNGELGYGDEDINGDPEETTVVSFGPSSTNKYLTTYFRKDFNVPAGNIASVELRIKRDDGAAVYINGVEVTEARSNLPSLDLVPAAEIAYDSPTSVASNEGSFTTMPIPASYLVAGDNTIAVEIHQVNERSSDISFDMALEVTTAITSQSSSISINQSTQVQARVLSGDGTWSPLSDAVFQVPGVPADATNLRLTEIYYHPSDDDDALEFIEVQNIGSSPVILDGIVLTDGPSTPYIVPVGNTLQAGGFAVIVSDQVAFAAANLSVTADQILGEWASGKLSNSGEQIRIDDASGNKIAEVNYDDGDLWAVAADGSGASLELLDPANTDADLLDKPYVWRASAIGGGTPGTGRVEPSGIVINEVLAHTDIPQFDSVELFNPTDSAINVSGWYLSDDAGEPLKYQIETVTTISAGGYLVLNESDFGGDDDNDFLLSAAVGEQVILTQSSDGDVASHIEDAIEFGATFNGQSLGRIPRREGGPEGQGRLAPLVQPSLGMVNGGFAWSDIIISEVNYHPADPSIAGVTDNDLEFIELYNPGPEAQSLTNWRLAINSDPNDDFLFTDESIAVGSTIVMVNFDPSDPVKAPAFRTHYGIDAEVTIVGPLSDSLSNSHGIVKLFQPDDVPEDADPDAPLLFPNVLTDEVFYDDRSPWATDADGGGDSLNRIAASTLGNFVASWNGDTPSPGQFSGGGNVSSIVVNNDRDTRSELTSISVTFDGPVNATVDDFQLTNLSTNEVVTGIDLQITGQVAQLTFTGGTSVTGSSSDVLPPTLSNGDYQLKFQRGGDFDNADIVDDFFRKFGDA